MPVDLQATVTIHRLDPGAPAIRFAPFEHEREISYHVNVDYGAM